jgi:hypothetical protein
MRAFYKRFGDFDRDLGYTYGAKALESGEKLEEVFSGIFKDYEHGLNLIREAHSSQQFEISVDVIQNPKAALDKWIRALYVSR